MKTSSGHDKISCIILKEIKDIIAQPLSLVVNQAFNTGVFPSNLKLAKVIPLYNVTDGDFELFVVLFFNYLCGLFYYAHDSDA